MLTDIDKWPAFFPVLRLVINMSLLMPVMFCRDSKDSTGQEKEELENELLLNPILCNSSFWYSN